MCQSITLVFTIQINSFDKPLVSNSLKVVNLSATGIQSCSNTTDLLEQALANLDNVSIPPDASEQITANAARYRQLLGGADPMLLWMVEDEELLAKIENGVHAVSQLLSSEHALVSIACASRLNEADSESQLVQWINLLQQKIVDGSHDTLDFLQRQWLLVELPLTMAYVLDSTLNTSAVIDLAVDLLKTLVDETLDTDGWPSNDIMTDFGLLCASLYRSLRLIDSLKEPSGEDSQGQTISGLPRQLMRLLRGDGTLMLNSTAKELPDEMLSAMLELSTDLTDQLILERTGKRPAKPRPNRVVLDRTLNSVSEWGGNFLFHDGWERNACKIAAMFDASGFSIEVGKKKSLILGESFPEVSFSGKPLAIEGEPELLVSLCDEQIAFAEVQWTMTGGVKLQRHVILSLEDRFAWIGDVILPPEDAQTGGAGGKFDYRCRWPLASGISTIAESETTEGYLYDGKKIRALVIPPALNEWKTERPSGALGAGKLELEDASFTLAQSGTGRALYAPLFLDLSPRRSKRPRTWRQLTVAEKLETVHADVAVAYRVQVGKKQFVFYRALGDAENRTFFGQNVNTELFLGRLEKDRSMTELLQVE